MNPSTLGLAALSFLFLAGNIIAVAPPNPSKPNIVFLIADDLGGGDLHCYGHLYARTPNSDSLARDGTRFTQFYATGATCCPTRTGLMASKFLATYPTYPANGGFAERVTVTELLKKQGYATGHYGKWHIGPEQKEGTYGIVVIGSDGAEQGGKWKVRDDERGRDAHIYDDAIQFIEKHKDGPFYINVWGRILKRLDEPGLRENTIVVFSTDQGADMSKAALGGLRFNQMGFNGPVRGGKHTAKWLQSTIAKSRQDLALPSLKWFVSQQPPTDEKGLNRIDVTANLAAIAATAPAFIHLQAFNLPPEEEKPVITTAGLVQLGELLAKSYLSS